MDQWEVIRIQSECSKPFIDTIINDSNIFEDNKNYKLALVYGKAGSFKSSIINIYMGSDQLDTGMESEGVTKGVYFCKKEELIIADTEGTGTDNSSIARHDIVSLFCVCSSFIIINAIYNRFPFKEITDMIEEKLAVLQRMYKNPSNNINKPSLIIVCPIGKEIKLDKIELFRNDAEKCKNEHLPIEIKDLFSDVTIKVLSPLPTEVHKTINEDEKFSVNDLNGSLIKNEVDEIFDSALIRNQIAIPGQRFHLLNQFYELAKNNRIINLVIFEQCTDFIQNKISMLSRNAKTCNCDYKSYLDNLNELKISIDNEISKLSINIIYKKYYKIKFEEQFKIWCKIHGDVFNEELLSHIEKVYEGERNSIITELKSNPKIPYQKFEEMINESKQKLKSIQYADTTNNIDKISKIINLIKSKVKEFDSNYFQDLFIELVICKPTQDIYMDDFKPTLNLIKIADKVEVLAKNEVILGDKLEGAINGFYQTICQPIENKSYIIDECTKNFSRDCSDYYDINIRSSHEKCLNLIEESRKCMINVLSTKLGTLGTYNPKLIDSFAKESDSVDRKFLEDVGEDLYGVYADDFSKIVIISQYDLLSTNATRSCIFSTNYYKCPDCGNIFEIRLETELKSYIGCGNFYCYGKRIGCNGKMFRTEMKVADMNNKLAIQLDFNDVIRECKAQINFMEKETMDYLTKNLAKKHKLD